MLKHLEFWITTVSSKKINKMAAHFINISANDL